MYPVHKIGIASKTEIQYDNAMKHIKPETIKRMILIYLIFLVLYAIRWGIHQSLYFMNDSSETGYLPVTSMNVFDEDGNALTNIKTPFDPEGWYNRQELIENNYHLGNDLQVDDTWETFVEKYGDYHYSYISVYYYSMDEDGYRTYDSHQYFYGEEAQSIAEFDEMYVQTSEYDLDSIEFNVSFRAYYFGNDYYYDNEDFIDTYIEYESRPLSFLFTKRRGAINYYITIDSDGIDYVSIDRYSYE